VAYALNSFSAGWGAEYGKIKNNNYIFIDEVEPTLYQLETDLQNEVLRIFGNSKVAEVFTEVFKFSFSAGMQSSLYHNK